MRMGRLVVAVVLAALVLPTSLSEAAGPFVATLRAPNHHPKANRLWYITVSARTNSGRPLRAIAWYEYYYQGQKVATRYPTPNVPRDNGSNGRPYAFRGSYRDGILWPPRSIGVPLTFRVVVKANGSIRKLDWKVVVRR